MKSRHDDVAKLVFFAFGVAVVMSVGLFWYSGISILSLTGVAYAIIVFLFIFLFLQIDTGTLEKIYLERIVVPSFLIILLIISLVYILLLLNLPQPGLSHGKWVDRDIMRSEFLYDNLAIGPELQHGPRTPGGFLYVLIKLVALGGDDSPYFRDAVVGLHALSAGLVALAAYRWRGITAAGVAASTLVLSTAAWEGQINLWNPVFIPVFSAMAVLIFVLVVVEGRNKYLPLLFLVSALGAQIHFSFFAFLISATIGLVVKWRALPNTVKILCGICVFVSYSPFLILEISEGMKITKEILGIPKFMDDFDIFPKTNRLSIMATLLPMVRYPKFDGFLSIFFSMAAPLGIIFLIAMAYGVIKLFRGPDRTPVMVLLATIAIGLTIFFIFVRNEVPSPRHVVYLSGPVSLFMGIGFATAIESFKRENWNGKYRSFLSIACFLGFVCWAIISVLQFREKVETRVLAAAESVRSFKFFHQSQTDRALKIGEHMISAATVIGLGDNNRTVASYVPWNYPKVIARSLRTPWRLEPPKRCFLNLNQLSPATDINYVVGEFLKTTLGQTANTLKVIKESDDKKLAVVTYGPVGGNCVKSGRNRFILSPEEERFMEWARSTQSPTVSQNKFYGEQAYFVTTRTGTGVTFVVTSLRSNERLYMRFDSPHFLGYSASGDLPNEEWVLSDTIVEIRQSNSNSNLPLASYKIPIIGDVRSGIMGPVFFDLGAVPHGKYDVVIKAKAQRFMATQRALTKELPVEARFTGVF